jgi:ribosomal protein S18 acetylase RimI-like enzyme
VNNPNQPSQNGIRKLDPYRDLLQVADLIERCFYNTMDYDGQDYLRVIRRAGEDLRFVQYLNGANERVSYPLSGYVYVENERIVGNLTLIPFYKNKKWIYLIANVAVDPDYRRRGIARLLTLTALTHVRARPVSSVWLQVRDDNSAAYQLYQSVGFISRCIRTNWQLPPTSIEIPTLPKNVTIRRPGKNDWPQQSAWLHQTYPPEVSWNLPIHINAMEPDFWHTIAAWFNDHPVNQWAAQRDHELLGVLSMETGYHTHDNLWLAVTPQNEDLALTALLGYTKKAISHRRSQIVNYPAERGKTAFLQCGFNPINTLIWMEINLNS